MTQHGLDRSSASDIGGARIPGILAFVILWLCASLGPARGVIDAGQPEPSVLRPLIAAFHVHSSMSTGSLTLDQLAQRAEHLGIDAIVLSDNFALRYEYGLPPLRGVFRTAMSVPSVTAQGAGQFVSAIRAAQARHPAVLFVPGVEVNPHYYWTGSLLNRNLTMHNSQRNLLAIGLEQVDDYRALPASGNVASWRYGWDTVSNASPVLLVVTGVWLWRRDFSARSRSLRAGSQLITGQRGAGLIVGATGVVLLMNAWPFSQPAFSPYDTQLGYRPYQSLINEVTGRGGLVVWSLPEARDETRYSFGPLGPVTVQTKPHPDALLSTTGYTGFGGLYQDTRRVAEPGGTWDRTIRQYLSGQRASYPILFGEIAFHSEGKAGIELNQVLNVLRVRERSVEGVLEAMRTGRLYAVADHGRGVRLRLDEFRAETLDRAHGARAGETLRVGETDGVTVQVSISATDDQAHPVSVTIVRTGEVAARLEGQTPFHHSLHEPGAGDHGPSYYRAVIHGTGELLSNPIFVVPRAKPGVS